MLLSASRLSHLQTYLDQIDVFKKKRKRNKFKNKNKITPIFLILMSNWFLYTIPLSKLNYCYGKKKLLLLVSEKVLIYRIAR